MEANIKIEPQKEKPYGKFDEWEIKHAVEVLEEAEEIRNNPDKMQYVFPLLQKKRDAADRALQAANLLYGKDKGEKK